jgi:thymidine kinase
VTANGLVALVIDRPRVEDRFGRAAITQHDGESVEAHVGAQDVEAVEARILGDALLVDLEAASGVLR